MNNKQEERTMKTTFIRALIKARKWANTPKGERIIVGTLTNMSVLGIITVAVLIYGYLTM